MPIGPRTVGRYIGRETRALRFHMPGMRQTNPSLVHAAPRSALDEPFSGAARRSRVVASAEAIRTAETVERITESRHRGLDSVPQRVEHAPTALRFSYDARPTLRRAT